MTIKEARKLFPHLKTEQIYFNHASLGPWCDLALKRINEYALQRSGEKIENYEYFLKWNLSAKEKLGKLIGTTPDRIAWIDNVSNGLNLLAQGLKWNSGDKIILNDIEFPSNVYPFMNLKKHGVEIEFIKNRNGIVDIEDIEKAITPKTKLISISYVQFLTGYRANIDAIGELCKKHNIIFCVDAIQAAGVVQIDVQKSKIDFLAGGTQKWLMSSQGLSYIFITEELQEQIEQKYVGWISVENAWNLLDYNLKLRKNADRFQTGTINALGVAIFDAVLNLFIEFGMENIESCILDNTNYFIEKLSELGLNPILKNVSPENRAGIITFKHNKSKKIFDELEKQKIYCAVREGMIRFSPHFYNTKEEIDCVLENLNEIIKKIE
ncbi:MAG: aminotransferase class V-fold PLP-dependent enzyme [Melioribacter sp.]|uniref:aminotransferase class V-fold PLP-dependent enzyme n=1 Tax=Rosettibacter primus TaxID=3111523 RepID=UPI00247B8095|nr:aminotransferase class V-fold PLP-dependent enzyme [Melioribacter sp.]